MASSLVRGGRPRGHQKRPRLAPHTASPSCPASLVRRGSREVMTADLCFAWTPRQAVVVGARQHGSRSTVTERPLPGDHAALFGQLVPRKPHVRPAMGAFALGNSARQGTSELVTHVVPPRTAITVPYSTTRPRYHCEQQTAADLALAEVARRSRIWWTRGMATRCTSGIKSGRKSWIGRYKAPACDGNR